MSRDDLRAFRSVSIINYRISDFEFTEKIALGIVSPVYVVGILCDSFDFEFSQL
jgi:hypothetical protein